MPNTEPVPTSSAALGCLIMIASITIPITVAVILPGPWPVVVIVAVVVACICIAVGSRAIDRVLKAATAADPAAPPSLPPTPGPADAVHYVSPDEVVKGCQLPGRHTPHNWFWRTDVMFTDGDGQARTAPVTGNQPCDGRGPR